MGYIRDEHIILTCNERKPLEKIRVKLINNIIDEFRDDPDKPDYSNYVSPVLNCLANSLYALFIPADGSKEGWTTSNAMDEVREKLRTDIINHNAKSDDKIGMIQVTDDEYDGLSVDRLIKQW